MKRHPSLVPLSKEHHEILILAQLLKKDAPPYKELPQDPAGKKDYAIDFYQRVLKSHIKLENKVLIPSVSGIDLEVDAILEDIIHEHKKIKKRFKNLADCPDEELEDRLDLLGRLIEEHIRKEERELFEKIQQVFPAEVLKDLEKDLKTREI